MPRRLRDSLSRWTSRLSRRFPHHTTPIDPAPAFRSADIARTAQAVRELKAEMDRSLSVLRAWAIQLDRRLRATEDGRESEHLRALGQMAGGMAHNLNNALAAILGYTELLLKDAPDQQAERRLVIIRQVALEAGVTVRRLQELVARHPQGASGPVSLTDVVVEALEITQPRWRDESERRGVRITIVRDLAPVPAVESNHADLRQALVHLILNAVDAMPSGGTLTVRSRSVEPGWVELEVADTGTERSDGLSEAAAVVQQYGGHLSMERIPDRASMVRLRLPESPFHLIPSRRAVEPCAPEQARKILVVDDDPRLLRALTDLLEGSGHAVLMAASGAEALQSFEAEAADLVITDLGMPGMTGWELAERIKARAPETPVFLLTGWGEAAADADASRFVDRIIAKPVSADAILGHLGEVPRRAGSAAS
jgi:CheY-like chemotaxis protein